MNTVTFGEYNSYADLNLILSSKTIGSPSVKTSTIDLPGSDGELDFTEYFGEPKYSNRTLKFQFTAINPATAFDSTVKNLLHGQKMKIVLSDDPDVYFYGRISVGDWYVNKGISTIDVECNCEPYRMKKNETVVQVAYGVSDNDNICPHFGMWSPGTGYIAESEDKIVFTKNVKVTSPKIQITESTWVTIRFGSGGRYYVNQYNASGASLKSTTANGTLSFQTVENVAYILILLYPASNASFPVTYSNLMMYVGQDTKTYARYNAADELICSNARKSVVPIITADHAVSLNCNGTTIAIAANTQHTIPEFELHRGQNKIKVVTAEKGTIIKAVYREGSL